MSQALGSGFKGRNVVCMHFRLLQVLAVRHRAQAATCSLHNAPALQRLGGHCLPQEVCRERENQGAPRRARSPPGLWGQAQLWHPFET